MMEQRFQLEVFEGPLDLLLYLIRKNEVEIYDIPIQKITEQYLKYIELMRMLDLDIAGEFLAMATTLMHIKSRLLLPPEDRGDEEEDEEEDPRWELVRQLLEYKRFKEAAASFHRLEKQEQNFYPRRAAPPPPAPPGDLPLEEVELFELLDAFSQVLSEAEKRQPAEFEPDNFTLEDGRRRVLDMIEKTPSLEFRRLFEKGEPRTRIVVVFLAILELIRQQFIKVMQEKHFGEIMLTRGAQGA